MATPLGDVTSQPCAALLHTWFRHPRHGEWAPLEYVALVLVPELLAVVRQLGGSTQAAGLEGVRVALVACTRMLGATFGRTGLLTWCVLRKLFGKLSQSARKICSVHTYMHLGTQGEVLAAVT